MFLLIVHILMSVKIDELFYIFFFYRGHHTPVSLSSSLSACCKQFSHGHISPCPWAKRLRGTGLKKEGESAIALGNAIISCRTNGLNSL